MMGVDIVFAIAVLIMSVVIHEVSHGYSAYMMGDSTAKYAGRLTLNPLRHLDLFGSIIVPLLLVLTQAGFVFGWAKPVPYNPYNLKDQKWGSAIVAVAGPASNFFMALFFGLVLRFGVGGFLPESSVPIIVLIVFINLLLGIFNLIPIPPLDGSKILFAILPYKWSHVQHSLEQYGFFIFLFFIFFLWRFLTPIILMLFKLITGLEF
ncbi:MAG: site-2 protease family protein [Candidatus Marinimicrobia bacterium]|nr:site-2 protease family protein [Candidatus Neomarinimicrobiota bacterium]